MSYEDSARALLTGISHSQVLPALWDDSSHWVADELSYARSAAQRDADAAYAHWRELPGCETYAIYRAAQDRADAAQDHLADWSRRRGGRPF